MYKKFRARIEHEAAMMEEEAGPSNRFQQDARPTTPRSAHSGDSEAASKEDLA